jgi:glycosyltransferase involved in cell wall biosynthesis
VSSDSPSVTVLIPTRPGAEMPLAAGAARRLDYPPNRLEILVARGRQPSAQRNAALREARGDLVYFLDDDSLPDPDNLRRALPHFGDPRVVMVGGPNLCPPDAPLIEQVFGVVLSSALAFGPSRARYAAVGTSRVTSEKELILCNLLARRADVLALGGFDEALYPNEENALMDGLQRQGKKLIYDPALKVHRRPRPSLAAFCKMLMTYGRGRAEQFRLHPTAGSALNFAPPLFCVYLAAVIALGFWQPIVLWPLAAYGLAVVAQTLASAARHGFARSVLAAPLVALSHVFYGLGFWRGLFTRLGGPRPAQAVEIALERVRPEGEAR